MESTQLMKFLETGCLALIIFLVYHCVMKLSKKAIERREAEEEEKSAQKAVQRQRMRKVLESKRMQDEHRDEEKKSQH